ncbi:hypothetical protein EYZ11_003858 [Aspergillus tanneri]|uniref:Uncharacterized protein n=1 Tax=Aspergillus tanneri TaxID=1220188 RepID=A0A4S3JMD0_9EURO|nr:hypothetical protein EYZ11_003858 [Aspergillus tanneri]
MDVTELTLLEHECPDTEYDQRQIKQ